MYWWKIFRFFHNHFLFKCLLFVRVTSSEFHLNVCVQKTRMAKLPSAEEFDRLDVQSCAMKTKVNSEPNGSFIFNFTSSLLTKTYPVSITAAV